MQFAKEMASGGGGVIWFGVMVMVWHCRGMWGNEPLRIMGAIAHSTRDLRLMVLISVSKFIH